MRPVVACVLAVVFAVLAWDGVTNPVAPFGPVWLPLAGVAAVACLVAAGWPKHRRRATTMLTATVLIIATVRAVGWALDGAWTPAAVWVGFGAVALDGWWAEIGGDEEHGRTT